MVLAYGPFEVLALLRHYPFVLKKAVPFLNDRYGDVPCSHP